MPTVAPTRLIAPKDVPPAYRLVSLADAAAAFHRTTKTLNTWIRSGVLPVVRIGRRVFLRETIATAYLEALNPECTHPLPPNTHAARSALSGCYLPMNDAATILGMHRNTLADLNSEGSLPTVKFGRNRVVPFSGIAQLIDQQSHPATTGPLAGRFA